MKTQMTQVKFTHKAVEQDCMSCHDAHASNFPKQIKQAPVEMCTSCHEHEKINHDATEAKFKHTIVTKDNACLNCHTAHGGDLGNLMRADPMKVCMKCHTDKIEVSKEKTIPAIAEVMDPSTNKHGPIKDGNCGGCHNVHGSDIAKLLSKPYPEAFYQGFAVEKYDLCFSCHDKQLVLTQKTEGLTGFRNGTTNLHFVHVNKSDRGRNCRACPSTHASVQPVHVRDSVPYGNWQMPLNFNKTETGGSCSPGCHKQYQYDRSNPVLYKSPATAPSKGP
jgi:predicted CXXCH cytochrome family protein